MHASSMGCGTNLRLLSVMKRVRIFGSCVTRDPVDSLIGKVVDLVGYHSKSSFISQCSRSTEPFPLEIPAGSDFGSRVVREDVEKSILGTLATNDYDFLLVDFVDDRLPLYHLAGCLYTGSRFFENSYSDHIDYSTKPLSVFSKDGQDRFISAVLEFFSSLVDSGVPQEKIIVHRAWWSRFYESAGARHKFADEKLSEVHAFNSLAAKAYKRIKEAWPESRYIECPVESIVADAGHKWGLDPFHFGENYNAAFRDRLTGILNGDASVSARPKSVAVRKQNERLVLGLGYENSLDRRDPFCTKHDLASVYITHDKEYVAKFRDTGVVFDDQGVPWNNFRWGGPYRYSVTIGHHGLSEISRFLKTGDQDNLSAAVSVADWLVENQREDGAWPVDFDHNWFPPRCRVIKSPWVSAMGQGLCISLLSRLAAVLQRSGDSAAAEIYVRTARMAIEPFKLRVSDGGVSAKLFDRHVFYEEYPTEPSSFVLNGFIYSLLGLYDFYLLTSCRDAHSLYKSGIETLDVCLPFYDLGRCTAYDLTHLTCVGYPPNVARYSYHFIHVQLLSVLNALEDGRFSVFLERWALYLKGWGDKGN